MFFSSRLFFSAGVGLFFFLLFPSPVFGSVCLITQGADEASASPTCGDIPPPDTALPSTKQEQDDVFCMDLRGVLTLAFADPYVCDDLLCSDTEIGPYLLGLGAPAECRALSAGAAPPSGETESAAPTSTPIPPIPLKNPLGDGNTNIALLIGRVIQYVMGILGAITLFVFVDGAWNWVTSAGFPQRVEQGIRTMLFAVAGLFVIFASYGILNAFLGILTTGS